MQSRARVITALIAAGLLAPAVSAQTATPQGQSTSTGQTQTTQPGNTGTAGREQNPSSERQTGTQQDQSTTNTSAGTSGQGSNAGQTDRRSGMQNGMKTGMKISNSDRKFMTEAAAGGMKEVELGRVAAQKATNPEIKQFAEKMVEEHGKVNEELKTIAASKGVTLPSAPDARLQATLTKMQNLSGAEFDRAYLKEAGVKEHEKAEKLFREASTRGKDPETRAFAAKVLPAVQQHLTEVRGLESSVSGSRMTSDTSTGGGTKSMSNSGHSTGSSNSSGGSNSSSGSGSSTGTSNPSGQGSNTSTRPQ